MPVPDKGNAFSRYVPPSRVLSYDYQFVEGQIVAYQCRTERQDILKGNYFNRTCQADGRWSGTRPWCGNNRLLFCLFKKIQKFDFLRIIVLLSLYRYHALLQLWKKPYNHPSVSFYSKISTWHSVKPSITRALNPRCRTLWWRMDLSTVKIPSTRPNARPWARMAHTCPSNWAKIFPFASSAF